MSFNRTKVTGRRSLSYYTRTASFAFRSLGHRPKMSLARRPIIFFRDRMQRTNTMLIESLTFKIEVKIRPGNQLKLASVINLPAC